MCPDCESTLSLVSRTVHETEHMIVEFDVDYPDGETLMLAPTVGEHPEFDEVVERHAPHVKCSNQECAFTVAPELLMQSEDLD